MAAVTEPRETSGLTSRLLLAYVEREGGREAVERMLELAGCADREAELQDEACWFSFDTKTRLFEAAAEALGDPLVTRHAGHVALQLGVADGLKVALRALGSPRLVYQHIVRANGKFTAVHRMELLDLARDRATISFNDTAGYDVHPLDCEYNQGLLAVVPELFGMDRARISHPVCAVHGHERCIYEIQWERASVTPRSLLGGGLLAGGSLAASALAAPALLPAAGLLTAGLGGVLLQRISKERAARWRRLEQEVAQNQQVAGQLSASLQDLVSELDLEVLLDKVVRNARAAVGSKEFALLVAEEDGTLRARPNDTVSPRVLERLEAWAATLPPDTAEPVLVEDTSVVPALAGLADDPAEPVGSVVLAPLDFRGRTEGHLVALAKQSRIFLPRDLDLVRSYAVQGAIALANARNFAAARDLATRDPLTDLLNHREFHESVGRELDRARRHGGTLAVALFDLDGFKLVNDGAGHAEGDRVLRRIAEALAAACRASDTAFRIGGDEFALLLPETGRGEAEAVAGRVREALVAVDPRVGASVGVAAWPQDGGSKEVLLAHADAELYAMKGARG
ncbi:MAG: sensor domain-containing diguanylate cyclase, partial [Solirubrobacterales bacterium]|nr:sensor domain-containing diguanylate cyclase [Solirubrobacterales bacterium]